MSTSLAKRKRTEGPLRNVKKPKRFVKQKVYHSSSESDDDSASDVEQDFAPVNMDDSEGEEGQDELIAKKDPSVDDNESVDEDEDEALDDVQDLDDIEEDEPDNEDDDLLGDDVTDATSASAESDSEADSQAPGRKRKRNDPSAFASSMSKILSSKLSTSKRSDPVLARSVTAATANKELTDSRLEAKAKAKLRADKKAAMERGRVRDVLGLETDGISAAEVQEREKRLKKTAQRGVVKLFNAVRAAQVQGEQARDKVRKEGVIGTDQREDMVKEMSKQGFLELIAKGGKKGATIEEG